MTQHLQYPDWVIRIYRGQEKFRKNNQNSQKNLKGVPKIINYENLNYFKHPCRMKNITINQIMLYGSVLYQNIPCLLESQRFLNRTSCLIQTIGIIDVQNDKIVLIPVEGILSSAPENPVILVNLKFLNKMNDDGDNDYVDWTVDSNDSDDNDDTQDNIFEHYNDLKILNNDIIRGKAAKMNGEIHKRNGKVILDVHQLHYIKDVQKSLDLLKILSKTTIYN